MERITVDLISNKVFTEELKGYSKEEVDGFLDDICDEMERMEDEIKTLREKASAPVVSPVIKAETAVDESRFREVLELAVKLKDETVTKAKEDAEAIRAKAEAEAQERLEGLGGEKERIEKEIEAMKQEMEGLKKVAADYRANFESLLQAQQEALEKVSGLF